MKVIEECVCPNCESKLMFIHSVLCNNCVKYKIICAWCYWESKEYKNETEVLNNYENEVL